MVSWVKLEESELPLIVVYTRGRLGYSLTWGHPHDFKDDWSMISLANFADPLPIARLHEDNN